MKFFEMKQKNKLYKILIQSLLLFTLCFLFWGGEKLLASDLVVPKVTNLKQIRGNEEIFGIEWKEISDARYEISISNDGKQWEVDGETSKSHYYFTQKKAGKTYYVKVRAYIKVKKPIYGEYSSVFSTVTSPANAVTNIKQIAQTETSITLKWGAVAGANGYQVKYIPYLTSKEGKVVTTTKTTHKITGLIKNAKYRIEIKPFNKNKNYVALQAKYNVKYVSPLPTKVTQIINNRYSDKTNIAYFKCKKNPVANGYQLEVYDGNKLVKSIDSKSFVAMKVDNVKLKAYNFFKFRVRAYINAEGVKKYGKWSDWSYFAKQSKITESKVGTGMVDIKWDSVNGATGYSVYVSTKPTTGYKKVTSTQATNANISNLISGKKYYYYVIPNKKVGSKTYSGILNYYWESVIK